MSSPNLVDQPTPKSDIEQIKPGAGKDAKQGAGAIDVEEGTMPEEPPPKKGNSVLRWRPTTANKGKAKDDSKEKLTATPVGTRGDRSKFVEDVSSLGPVDQTKGNTLKKEPMK
jgi:hypothetical protein